MGFSDSALIKSLRALKLLKASTFYPVVLAMKQKPYSESDIRDVVQAIEIYMFRNITICKRAGNKVERFFAEVAKEIYDETLNSTSLILDRIKAETVGDQEFSDSFRIWSGSKASKEVIRYIFRKVHKLIEPHSEINIDNSEVHIEHIMPEDPSNWEVPDDVHETYLWRLGNLALLSGTMNISISNKTFDEKKERYLDSKIEPNKEIASYTQWTADEIEERQKKLAEYAMQIWSK